MPRKKRAWRKPIPAILRTRIEGSSSSTSSNISQQVERRIQAVYDLFGVDREAPQSADLLVELMAKTLFPTAFECRPKGYPKTKKLKWTMATRQHLLEFFRDNYAPGMSQEDVARLYIKQFGFERSPKGLVAEFKRAEKWESAGGEPTAEELDELIDRWAELESEIRRGK